MSEHILDLPLDARPDPDEFVRAAMEWHFNPETGSAYWLNRAKTLDFDPREDVKGVEGLSLFPNIINELRDVCVEDLIPRGYGAKADVVGVYESGGTTGAPKRVIILRDWWQRIMAWMNAGMDEAGFPRDVNWLVIMPSGPHMAGKMSEQHAVDRGGIRFTVDMDPRWVKKLVAAGKAEEAEAYAEHLIEQARFVLSTQDVGVIITTPPLLERITRHDDLVDLINEKVKGIVWGGAHMDVDTRHLYRTEVFPGVKLRGTYGSTMILGGSRERLGLADEDACIFDPPAPWITFHVIDPDTGRPVDYGERGQVVMNHVTRNMLLPNNLERDLAIRVEPPAGQVGDSVANVSPVARFDDEAVIEGVY
ncbi:phenazine antibiotic biosynthesis protein [Actinoallomurus spadix]|uniref:AMP-binding protein n=1 Tax=Actinoallomurus spadix TaxID=79912 RepID=A0ABP3FKV9_9ACTN|nr:phenazine antibiotic biosynthesis protein [Actinoallomurus spadix]MCO5987989.1 phenazine antibiotic biosynthesis protein [Actinoallomurus spadix]